MAELDGGWLSPAEAHISKVSLLSTFDESTAFEISHCFFRSELT